jgi:hypothetical protein
MVIDMGWEPFFDKHIIGVDSQVSFFSFQWCIIILSSKWFYRLRICGFTIQVFFMILV